MEIPRARPAGTQPFMISLANSCPDRSEVKGVRRWPEVSLFQLARGATPGPPSSSHSVVIRSMALCRASYMVLTRGANDPKPPWLETWVTVRAGMPYPQDPQAPGQL